MIIVYAQQVWRLIIMPAISYSFRGIHSAYENLASSTIENLLDMVYFALGHNLSFPSTFDLYAVSQRSNHLFLKRTLPILRAILQSILGLLSACVCVFCPLHGVLSKSFAQIYFRLALESISTFLCQYSPLNPTRMLLNYWIPQSEKSTTSRFCRLFAFMIYDFGLSYLIRTILRSRFDALANMALSQLFSAQSFLTTTSSTIFTLLCVSFSLYWFDLLKIKTLPMNYTGASQLMKDKQNTTYEEEDDLEELLENFIVHCNSQTGVKYA